LSIYSRFKQKGAKSMESMGMILKVVNIVFDIFVIGYLIKLGINRKFSK